MRCAAWAGSVDDPPLGRALGAVDAIAAAWVAPDVAASLARGARLGWIRERRARAREVTAHVWALALRPIRVAQPHVAWAQTLAPPVS